MITLTKQTPWLVDYKKAKQALTVIAISTCLEKKNISLLSTASLSICSNQKR
jgi:hypothetical protein